MTTSAPEHAAGLVPAAYPMVEEAAASGETAAIYAAILEHLPMVPSLFKSLACCPGYLGLAWEQTRRIIGDERFTAAMEPVVDDVADAVPPPEDPSLRDLLAQFVDPLARMLLVTAGLRLALDRDLRGEPASSPGLAAETTAGAALSPTFDVPAASDLDAGLIGAIRRDLATPIVNSVWRVAAAHGRLAEAWEHFGPLTREPAFRDSARRLGEQATTSARDLEWPVLASPAALQRQGAEASAAGASTILDAYLATLPRVLTLVASSRPSRDGG